MTTITALNVRLGMDVSNFSEGANLAKAETNRVAAVMRQSVPAAEKYKQELGLLNRAFSDAGKKSAEYANAVEFLRRKYDTVTPAIRAANAATRDTVSATTSAMSAIRRLGAAYLGLQTVAKAIKLATEVEDTTVAFEVLTGSVNDAKVLFEQVREFAKVSPVTFSQAAQATRVMMSFGVAAQDVERNLRMLSDVTGGNNERFKMMSLAFSQMSAAGRLMGQDLLQMINAGFNPLQQISRTTGESLIDLRKRMEDGRISADEVRQAFADATAEGGMFHGMTERLAETMGGKLNIAMSQWEEALAAAGEAMAPLIISLTDGFEKGQSVLDGIVVVIEKIVDGLRTMIALEKDAWNMDFDMTAFNKLLDELDQRKRDRAAEATNEANLKFENEKQAVKALSSAELDAIEASEKAQEKAVKEWEKSQKRAIKEAEKARLKAIEDTAKAEVEAAKAFQRELEEARKEAMKFFEDEEKKRAEIRKDVAAGPGAGAGEIGSSEYVKFFADTVNRQIGAAAAVPDQQEAREIDIARKTAELLVAQREANAQQQRQLELSREMLAEMQQNGFRRIR